MIDTYTARIADLEEESKLIKQVKQRKEASLILLDSQKLSNEEVKKYKTRIKIGEKAVEKITKRYDKLIHQIAFSKSSGLVEVDDLVQIGRIALLDACEKYQTDRGSKFSTFARYLIESAIKNEVLKILYYYKFDFRRFKKIMDKYGDEDGKNIGKPKRIENYLIYTDESKNPHILVIEKQMVNNLLSVLDNREKKIIKMRLGFSSYKSQNFAEIGEKLNLTRSRVQQIYKSSIEKMKIKYEKSYK